MGKSKSYWVKPARRTSAPAHLAAVVVTTRAAGVPARGSGTPSVWDRASVSHSSRRRGRWSPATEVSALTGPALLTALEHLAPARGSLWVVSPSASASLVLAGFLPYLLERGARWAGGRGDVPEGAPTPPAALPESAGAGVSGPLRSRRHSTDPDALTVSAFVTSSKVDIVRYHVGGKTITWVSGRQFFTASEPSLAQTCGYRYRYGFTGDGLHTDGATDPADAAALWLTLFQQLSDWWVNIDGGPFSATPGGLAMSYVRKRLLPRTVLSCQDASVRQLEEAAIFGGRATTFCYCPVARSHADASDNDELRHGRPYPVQLGPVDLYDVRSMYPTLLATQPYPARYLHTWERPTPAQLSDMLSRWLVIASVKLSTRAGEYPLRDDGRITNPVGTFRTVLTTPELRRALSDGCVVECYRAQTYLPGRPFAGAFADLLGMRQDARDRGDAARSEFVKLLSNSFGGKLAQRSHEWKRRPDVRPELDWGEWIVADGATGARRRFRSRAGLVDEYVPADLPTRPLSAHFAHLTAYGRDAMRQLRESLPARSVVSQDTDGIWVLRSRVGKTESLEPPSGYPELTVSHKQQSERARWYGPRHYWTDQGWTLAGLSDPCRWGDGLGFADSYRITPVNTGTGAPPVWVYDCQRYVRLGDIPADGSVGADGWTVPHKVFVG